MAPISATRLLFTTNLQGLSGQFFSLLAAADRASAAGSLLTAASPGQLVPALPTFLLAMATVSLAGATTTHLLLSSGECMSRITTSLLVAATHPSRSCARVITVPLGVRP